MDLFDAARKSFAWGTEDLATDIRMATLEGFFRRQNTPDLDVNEIMASMGRGIYDLLMGPARTISVDLTPSLAIPAAPFSWEARQA